MMQCGLQCALLLVIFALTESRPQNLQDSITSVIKTLELAEEPSLVGQSRRLRPRIITKYDFLRPRGKKSHLDLPPEFVVSTGLTVTQKEQEQASSQRSGRSQKLFGSRQAKTNFVNLAEAVKSAPVIKGVRLPDDETDRVVHRNGRFINNVFVPNTANNANTANIDTRNSFLPLESVVSFQFGSQKPLERSGRSYLSQNEVTGGSAYTFEPANSYVSQNQHQQAAFLPANSFISQDQQAAVLPASNEDFVIQQQTYQSCPTCPTFSIPVPVPKASYNEVASPHKKKRNIMDRLMDLIKPAVESAREFFNDDNDEIEVNNNAFANRVSPGEQKGPVYAGLAAMGLGLATMLSSRIGSGRSTNLGRKFNEDNLESLNSIDNDVLDYSMGDILCMPRNYCEKLKRKKFLIDQYPHMKTVATWMADKYFAKVDNSNNEVYSECNVRECLMELLD